MKKHMLIGLTGTTGAGKTTVCAELVAHGFYVIDADKVSRQVVLPNTECLSELVCAFGREILMQDGTLNRRALGGIVFSNKDKLAELNSIIYPHIIAEIARLIDKSTAAGNAITVLDAPTLFESGCDKLCDRIAVVVAPRQERLERIIKRDGITEEEAIKRINSQLSDDFFKQHADYVIDNAEAPDTENFIQWLRGLKQQ